MVLRRMGRATGGVSEAVGGWYTSGFANMALVQALGEPGYTGLGSRGKYQVCRGYGWNGEKVLAWIACDTAHTKEIRKN